MRETATGTADKQEWEGAAKSTWEGKKAWEIEEERTVLSVSVHAGILFRETPRIYSSVHGYYQPEKRRKLMQALKGKRRRRRRGKVISSRR